MTERNLTGMKHRWTLIQANINKFHAILSKIQASPPSGYNDNMMVEEAISAYVMYNGVWKWMQCYNMVKDSPKWKRLQLRNDLHPTKKS
ncbi:hypothetical protein IFM89_022196 [Coptis chinensis]|uniref:Uncharacterized protein n=1 Tax=Coptis chinensis TaxID=261450 RepID=A0A835LV19_9MAGN|nr:hypothetical protein IFM89_022196 [Coptis chinensis]